MAYNNRNYEYPALITEKIKDALNHIDSKVKVNVRSFISSKGFHDRSVIADVIDTDGNSLTHVFDLTGGIEYLMDPKRETKIFYFRP